MARVRRWGILVLMLLALAGCSAAGEVRPPGAPAPPSDGTLVSGRFTTKQGTLRVERTLRLHEDGRVTQIQTVEGTDRFGDLWRGWYQEFSAKPSEYLHSMEERDGKVTIKFTREFPSADLLNEAGAEKLQLLDGPLFRSVSYEASAGPYDSDTLIGMYEAHEQATAEDWVNFLRSAIMVGYVIDDEVTGRTYRWDHTAGEIGQGLPVVIQGKEWRATAYVGGGVIAAFLLFVLYMGLFGRRHWASEE